ncbi:hypothetical protein CGRA01v4_05093 [Colletotrichum graminicola]|nr:hypothetical protein CGRA01v4_05093 [Colletotrichum graminicola]
MRPIGKKGSADGQGAVSVTPRSSMQPPKHFRNGRNITNPLMGPAFASPSQIKAVLNTTFILTGVYDFLPNIPNQATGSKSPALTGGEKLYCWGDIVRNPPMPSVRVVRNDLAGTSLIPYIYHQTVMEVETRYVRSHVFMFCYLLDRRTHPC